jgi:hypothetical protein
MSDVQIVEFHPKHFEIMDLRPEEKNAIFSLPDAYERFERVAAASVQAATFIHDGRILFCAGFSILWSGVADFWMVPSIYAKAYPLTFYRIAKRYLKVLPETFKLHRMQTTSYDDPFHEKWMNKLGFQKEGTLRKYRPDQSNMCFYGRIL